MKNTHRIVCLALFFLLFAACQYQKAGLESVADREKNPAQHLKVKKEAVGIQDSLIHEQSRDKYSIPLFYDKPIMLYIGDEDFKTKDSLL